MNRMKLVAVISMVLASSAFGALSITVTGNGVVGDGAGGYNVPVGPDGRSAVMTLAFSNPDGVALWGYSIKGLVAPGLVKVDSRSAMGKATDVTDSAAVGKMLEAIGDLGYTGPTSGDNSSNAASVPIMTLGLVLAPPTTIPPTIPITFQATAFNPNYDEFAVGDLKITLVPEPASMLLVAAGAAFFARRRRLA